MNNRLIKSNDAGGGGGCTNTVDLYNPFPDGGGVALYQLNGDATDESGNYDGTATNVTYGTGQFGQAGVFNGSSSAIDIAATATTPLDFSNRNYTLSAWVKTTITGFGVIIAKYGDTDALRSFTFGFANGTLRFYERINGGGTTTSANTSVNDGNWHHVVVTKSPTQTIIYIDGAADVTNNNTTTANDGGTYPIQIGRDNPLSPDWFDGSIDQVRIFNRALRPYEVEALYTEEYCTPTIVPSEHFNTVTYSGNGSTQSITGVGFQPDLVWAKRRSSAEDNVLFDSVRGVQNQLVSNKTNAESTKTNALSSFDSDGFTTGANNALNTSGQDYVAWNFKAGGAAVTNTDGTITSQVSANTEAGFSIVTFTGNGTTASVGHGLGQKPSIIFTKNRSVSEGWFTQQYMYVPSGNAAYGYLNTTAAFVGFTDSLTDDTVMQQGGTNGQNYVSYCFAEVEGFSSFGSYVGTGASGNTVVTGFEPAFVMIKSSSIVGNWFMHDNKRNPDLYLRANTNQDESGSIGTDAITFLENGFSIDTSSGNWNQSGASYIYMAFAADPTAVEPTLEDSFNTVTWTGNNGTQSIAGVGFQPDFVWAKSRTLTTAHNVFDSIRGATKYISSNLTDAESTVPNSLQSFNSDGFTVGSNPGLNWSSNNYVAWAWKGAEIPAINSNGSIPSVVSANPAAGFSIVSYSGNSNASATIGHGLGVQPKFVVVKRLQGGYNWMVGYLDGGVQHSLYLNTTAARDNELNRSPIAFTENTFKPSTLVGDHTNGTGSTYIAYCFAEVAGFSKFGSYTGNGSNQYINLGFEPAFIMVKRTDNTGTWGMFDNKRGLAAPQPRLLANDSASENTGTTYWASTDSTGFTVQGSSIYGSGNFIYMAFANQF